MRIQFFLYTLLLNSFDGNDAFLRHSMLVKQSSSFSRKHWTLSRSVSAKESWPKLVVLQNLGIDAGTLCTPVRDTIRLEAAPHWHTGKHITKRHRRSSWSMEKAVICIHGGKRTSLWTSA